MDLIMRQVAEKLQTANGGKKYISKKSKKSRKV